MNIQIYFLPLKPAHPSHISSTMEFESDDGSKISLNPNSTTEFGRPSLNSPNNQTISRRHIVFKLPKAPDSQQPRVHFQVVGKNPVWVLTNGDKDLFRSSEKGEMRIGDSFFVASKNPVLFKLKKSEGEEEKGSGRVSKEEEMEEIVQSGVEGSELDDELGFESVDVSSIDAVKEFGFLVIGHELDNYPKSKIRPINQWNWFLEEPRADSDTDEASETKKSEGKRSVRKKRKGKPEDDEEWTGDSEDEKGVISNVGKAKKPRYTTRSKVTRKPLGDTQSRKRAEQKESARVNKEEEEEDDDDEETLGGFIVNDEELGQEEEEEEEEEFEDDDEDD